MKRSLVYIMLGTLLFNDSSLLVSNVQAVEKSVISFLSNEKGNYDIFMIDMNGNVLERLATDAMRKSSFTCCPNGYIFAFQSNENANLDIYKMDIRHKISIRLTHHPERDLWPAWSPNGKWIAFVSDREGTQDIYRMDVDGSNLIRLTDQGISGKPAWSPNSQLIGFNSQREEMHAIYTMNADGKQLRQLTGDLQLGPGCTWSPDGQLIVYAAGNFAGEGMDIFTIDVDKRNINQLTNMGRGIRTGNPAWSPDGKWIAYSVVEVTEWPNLVNGFRFVFGDSTIFLVETKGGIPKPLKETADLSSDHVPVWISVDHFSVYLEENKQIVTWGKLKQH